MISEQESFAVSALPDLYLHADEITAALDALQGRRDPQQRKQAALRLGLDFPSIRAIGVLVELAQQDSLRASDFIALRGASTEERKILRALLDRVLADPRLLMTLRDVMPTSFPLPAGPPLLPLRSRLRLLADTLSPVEACLRQLGYGEQARSIAALAADLRSFVFRVHVIGEFSSGKSTLINALLGRELLPTGFVPVTPAPTRIQFGERLRLFLKRRTTKATAEAESEQAPELLQDLCLPDGAIDVTLENARRLNLEYIRVEVPAPLCQDGIEIVDTPGLNDTAQLSLLIEELLPTADAVILVLRANQPLTEAEVRVLRQAAVLPPSMRRWLDAGFVAFTFTDVVREGRRGKENLERVQQRAEAIFADVNPPAGFARGRRFYVNARGALAARLGEADPDATTPDFERLEQGLQAFLAHDRGEPLEAARRQQASNLLGTQRQLLVDERDTIVAGQRLSEDECADLARRIESIRHKGQALSADLRVQAGWFVDERARLFQAHADGAQSALSAHLKNVHFSGKVALGPKKAVDHFAAAGQTWLRDEIARWAEEDLFPRMQHFLSPFERRFATLQDEARAVGGALHLSKNLVVGGITVTAEPILGASAAGMFLSTALGGTVGALAGLGAALALALTIAIPIGAIIGAVLGLLGFAAIVEDRLVERTRDEVARQFGDHLRSDTMRANFQSRLMDHFTQIADFVDVTTNLMTDELRDHLAIQQAARRGHEAEARCARLAQAIAIIDAAANAMVAHDPVDRLGESGGPPPPDTRE